MNILPISIIRASTLPRKPLLFNMRADPALPPRCPNVVVATKALSSKLAKACYFIMRDQVDFDVKKIFG